MPDYDVLVIGAAGQGEHAARLPGAQRLPHGRRCPPQPLSQQAAVEQAVAQARAALGEEAWAVAFAAGRSLSLEQVIAEALSETV